MTRYFKTFWNDNRLIFLIIASVTFTITTLYTFFVTKMISVATSNDVYGGSFTIMLMLFGVIMLLVMMLMWLVPPGTALFIALRNFTGKSKLRYAMIRMSRVSFFFGQVLTYIFITFAIAALVILGVIAGILLSGNVLTLLSPLQDIGGVIKQLFSLSIILMFFGQLFTWITNFFFWALLIILFHTKSFRRLPSVGRVFSIIGIALGYLIIVFIFNMLLSFNQSSLSDTVMNIASSDMNNWVDKALFMNALSQFFGQLLVMLGFGGIYFFLLLKRYEV